MKTQNLILYVALVAASVTGGYLYYQAKADNTEVKAKATLRPVFSLPDIDGTPRSITEWDGKAMVVNFWATWCAPCRREIPVLVAMHDELLADDIQIIGIAMDDPAAVAEFAKETEFNYPVLVGEQEAVDAAEGFGIEVMALPLTVFTDHDGRIIEIHAGELTQDDLVAATLPLRQQ